MRDKYIFIQPCPLFIHTLYGMLIGMLTGVILVIALLDAYMLQVYTIFG